MLVFEVLDGCQLNTLKLSVRGSILK